MKKLFLIPFILMACQPSQKSADEQAGNNDSTQTMLSSPAEQPAGDWVSLFDGKTLDGWRAFKNQENTGWDVQDSAIHCKAAGPDLITDKEYANFEFETDWKISAKGNSGIIYRVTEDYDQTFLSGPEYQLLDNVGYDDPHKTGANYDMNEPSQDVTNPPGQWNHTRIVVNGNHVEHWLNGVKVVEYELHSDAWKANKAKSKWKDAEGYGMADKGHIALQDHGGHQIWFKNIRIKTL